jgi:hypothetical protein
MSRDWQAGKMMQQIIEVSGLKEMMRGFARRIEAM